MEGIVKFFKTENGWGALVSPDVPGDVFVHFSAIEGGDWDAFEPGAVVEFDVEEAEQDSFRYRATRAAFLRPGPPHELRRSGTEVRIEPPGTPDTPRTPPSSRSAPARPRPVSAAPPPTPAEFLDAVQAGVIRFGGADWIAGRADGDAIVVLFRQHTIRGARISRGPVEGVRLVFGTFAAQILGPGQHTLDSVLLEAVLEIVEPHEPGTPLDVPWADGLDPHPQEVLWRPPGGSSR